MPHHHNKKATFVFEDWRSLAEKDPHAFEQQRQNIIESLISSAPSTHRARLERLQWRIDMERKLSATPLAACVRISNMMLDSLYGERGLVSALNGKAPTSHQEDSVSAQVVPLAKRKQSQDA